MWFSPLLLFFASIDVYSGFNFITPDSYTLYFFTFFTEKTISFFFFYSFKYIRALKAILYYITWKLCYINNFSSKKKVTISSASNNYIRPFYCLCVHSHDMRTRHNVIHDLRVQWSLQHTMYIHHLHYIILQSSMNL